MRQTTRRRPGGHQSARPDRSVGSKKRQAELQLGPDFALGQLRPESPRFLPNSEVKLEGELLGVFNDVLTKIPGGTPEISSVTRIRSRKRGATSGMVGLTKYSSKESSDGTDGRERQWITFYTSALRVLSKKAVAGVIAHELAHAWLNEHEIPEQSRARENEADGLAKRWGFEQEIYALSEEGG